VVLPYLQGSFLYSCVFYGMNAFGICKVKGLFLKLRVSLLSIIYQRFITCFFEIISIKLYIYTPYIYKYKRWIELHLPKVFGDVQKKMRLKNDISLPTRYIRATCFS
jgi:hypothetical protein